MRYVGGKSRIAKHLAPIVNSIRAGRVLWEPFCGGLAMTHALGGPMIATDKHPGLIALAQNTQSDPRYLDGLEITEPTFRWSKTLPEGSPIAAFCRFGCSYSGNWFGGFARNDATNNYAQQTANALKKACRPSVLFACVDFFNVAPVGGSLIYADPPYANSEKYLFDFDSARFFARCLEWAEAGSPVFISEYECQIGREVWANTNPDNKKPGMTKTARTERLFLCA